MTPAKIVVAAADGYSIICATCRHLHRVRDLQGRGVGCGQECGGPLAGRDFPKYDGPITDFTRWCFMCGEMAKYGVMVKGSNRLLGVCKEHVRAAEELRPVGWDGEEKVITEVKTPDGRLVAPDRLLGKRPRSLIEEIMKTEAEFAERDGS